MNLNDDAKALHVLTQASLQRVPFPPFIKYNSEDLHGINIHLPVLTSSQKPLEL